ncbi:MAG: VWA domain-containing protein [Gammaproteobacteria bacterium]|nr:VWA domain-containing protein [Gammaproteobacteria bacterium]
MNTLFITRYFISGIVLLSLTACGIPTTNTTDKHPPIILANPKNKIDTQPKKNDSSRIARLAENKENDIMEEQETAVFPERHKARKDQLTNTLAKSHNAKILQSAPLLLQKQMADIAVYSRPMPALSPQLYWPTEPVDHESYAQIHTNPVMRVTENPVSTFSIDVDSGSYTNTRRMIMTGQLPPQDAVRIEEFLNYFDYAYPVPANVGHPFSVTTEIGPSPWSQGRHLLRIGLKAYNVDASQLPASNIVYLVDVSGSMRSANKLELLKQSLRLLTRQLRQQDRISIVVYAGASGVVLNPTPGHQRSHILSALDRLTAGGSTNGGAGIRLAYQLAEQAFIPEGINRIILASDGDFNVGTVSFEALIDLVEEKRKTGITLSTLAFGTGNVNDQLMEQLSNKANGQYAYIDTLNEAQKVLVDEISSTLQTIAKDTKIQIEFNPDVVSEYRLIGYENRALKREDFNNDNVDAGELGAGYRVTALYELSLVSRQSQMIDPLRYPMTKQPSLRSSDKAASSELAFLRLRYKLPESNTSTLIEHPIYTRNIKHKLDATSIDFRFAASVAAFGQLLRGGQYTGTFQYQNVLSLARNSKGEDPFGYRGEFIRLVNLANSLASRPTQPYNQPVDML